MKQHSAVIPFALLAKIERFDDLLDPLQNFRGALQAIQTIGSGDSFDEIFLQRLKATGVFSGNGRD